MSKAGRMRLFTGTSLAFVIMLVIFSTSIVAVQSDPFKDIEGKLNGISEKEKENLKKLFVLNQEITDMDKQEKALAREIDATSSEIKGLESEIAKEEASFESRKEDLRQVLRSYQRMGPGTYMEIILDSDSLSSFIRRVNILRDLTHNTGYMLTELEDSRNRLSAQKAKLTETLAFMKVKQKQLQGALENKVKLKEEMEKFLVSLAEERKYYRGFLADIQKMWEELKPIFKNSAKEFSGIIEKGNLPQDALKISFTFKGIKGSINEDTFNNIIKNNSGITDMVFDFTTDKVEVSIPDKNLMLSGKFVISEGRIIKFKAETGSFYMMPLEAGTIEELFQEGDMQLDLKPMLGNTTLDSIEVKDGSLELSIKP